MVFYVLVSYPIQKVRLQWDDAGVVLNPELKLLQYNLGQPLEVAESIGYMPEKHGKDNHHNKIYQMKKMKTNLLFMPKNKTKKKKKNLSKCKLFSVNKLCTGNYSRLSVNFRFERQIGHHLIQTFAPSTLVVMLSWFSFWLGLDAIPGRVTLLVTCMLTLVTMFTGLRADIPPVAYVKVNWILTTSNYI